MTVRLFLFGAPTIESGVQTFALPFERRTQLLVLLALKRSWVGRAEIAALLWPEQDSKLAYTNLRKTLFRLQNLPWAPAIESQGGALRFDAPSDVAAFESALRERRVAEALSLRRGDLLAGFDDGQHEAWTGWLAFERDRLRVAWRSAALERLADAIEPAEGIDLSARLLDADPLDEAALRAHLTWLGHDGQAGRARQAYRDFATRLAQDLGLAPGAELKALHDSIGTLARPSAPTVAPATSPSDAGFVGRTVELRRISALLAQDDCRVLCLVGPGGVGKTRLARHAMQALAPGHADGAVFVPLEDISAPGELGGRLARELGVRLTGSADPLDQVVEFLHGRDLLLVLDNFEQLVEGAPALARLVQASARLRIIVTSRVRLAIAMEWLLPIEGLPCPEAEDHDRIEAFDAGRLFVQAARRVEPALVPAVEAAAIADICRQVEGLPLALELAASWTRVLSCDAIAAELRQGTELLQAVDAAQPARHASFDVVFDQSWRLLGAAERDALARLSVFRGGFSAEAARAVAAASLPVLGALADKSLLRKDDARLFMHPLVQQLAALRLGEGDVRAATESAHAHHFHRLLAQRRHAVETGDREALQVVETEFENCRAAWRWSVAHEQVDALARSTPTLLHFCDHRARFEEVRTLLGSAVDARPAQADPRFEPLLASAVAHLEYRMDRYLEAEATAARALAASRTTHDHDTRLQCLKVLGGCCLRLGRHAEARRYFKQALQQSTAGTDPHQSAAMLDNLALVEKTMGRFDEALRLSLQSLVQHQRLGDVAGEALCLNNLGALYLDTERYESAVPHLRQGLALCDRHGLVSTRALILANLAELAMKTDDAVSARDFASRALDIARAAGNRSVASAMELQLAHLALRRGDLPAARSALVSSLVVAIGIGRPSLQLEGVACFAELLAAQGEPDCARLVLAFAADHASLSASERKLLRTRLAQWPPSADGASAWPGVGLDDLLHRIVVEADIAHAPLIAVLRGAR
jgi:predicted ATPase/DNA-binding SARP family transcriptional activator/Tfp pilus assembly protein PilF